MKTINRIFSYSIILIFSIGIIACSGSDGTDGVIGPQGPAGIDGSNGSDGLDGSNGLDGLDGNANVIASNWLDADWNLTDDPTLKEMQISISEISNTDLRDNTLVMVYLKQYGISSIYTMPSAGRWTNTWYSFTFGKNTTGREGIVIYLKSTDGVALTELQEAGLRGNSFRYILIPTSTTSNKSTLDYSNYNEIVNYYGLSF